MSDAAESSSESCLRSSLVIPPIPINTTEEERRLAQAYSEKLDRLGVSVVFKKKNDRREQRSEVTRLPACLVEREANMLKKAKQPIATDLAEVSKNSCSCIKPGCTLFEMPIILNIQNSNSVTALYLDLTPMLIKVVFLEGHTSDYFAFIIFHMDMYDSIITFPERWFYSITYLAYLMY